MATITIKPEMASEIERWRTQIAHVRDGAWESICSETDGAQTSAGAARAADIADQMSALVDELERTIDDSQTARPSGDAVAGAVHLNLQAAQLANREADLIAAITTPSES